MVSNALRLSVIFAVVATLPVLAQSGASQLVTVRHCVGTGRRAGLRRVRRQPDGSYNMWFGYMNRNYEEEVDLPVGAGQHVRAGRRPRPADAFHAAPPQGRVQGHRAEGFRRSDSCVWKLTAHGQTQQVIGTLKPVWQIDRLRTTRGGNSEKISSNLPPVGQRAVVESDARGARIADARPSRRPTTACRSGAAKPVGMTVMWAKYRGPGAVHVQRAAVEARRRQGLDDRELQRAGRVRAAGGRRRRLGRVGRQLRLSLLLDEHAGEDHRQGRRAVAHARRAASPAQVDVRQGRRADLPGEVPDLPSPGHLRADVARHATKRCGRGRARFSSASPTATCRRGISTRPSASATTRTTAR